MARIILYIRKHSASAPTTVRLKSEYGSHDTVAERNELRRIMDTLESSWEIGRVERPHEDGHVFRFDPRNPK